MRVLMLSWEYPPHVVGGLGNHVAEIAPALAELGVEVHLLTPRWTGGDTLRRDGLATVYRVDPPDVDSEDVLSVAEKTNKTSIVSKGRELFRTLGGFDLIHVHDWLVGFAGFSLKNEFKTPLLSTIHATERGRNNGALHNELQHAINDVEWRLTYESWRVICCSHYMASEVERFFGTPPDKIDVIPNGILTGQFDSLDRADLSLFRARFAAPSEKIVFYVGRLVFEKGLHVLVQAMPQILAQCPDAKFVIAGTGGMSGSLRQQAHALGVGQKVYFTGFISDSDRNKLLKVADCAVFPSLYEPFGIVALEAMSAKTPVVVTETGGLREVVEHGETGITVYPGNVESLTWGIVHTLRHPAWARARVANAYRRVVSEFDWHVIAERTLDVYRRIILERSTVDW